MSEQLTWPRVPLMRNLGGSLNHNWHVAINEHNTKYSGEGESLKAETVTPFEAMRFMYDAKHVAEEVPRLALLFSQERQGTLTKVHQQCSHSKPEPVKDNHLTCCLGVKCAECTHLKALDRTEASPEERDWIKAWTCATHIISEGGDLAGEGFITTVDDRMFWDNVYESLASV